MELLKMHVQNTDILSGYRLLCSVAIAENELQLAVSTYDVLRILSVGVARQKPFSELFMGDKRYWVPN
ncbi:MAG: hypothetical protein ACLVEJ_29215 [Parabacteroides sp.]